MNRDIKQILPFEKCEKKIDSNTESAYYANLVGVGDSI